MLRVFFFVFFSLSSHFLPISSLVCRHCSIGLCWMEGDRCQSSLGASSLQPIRCHPDVLKVPSMSRWRSSVCVCVCVFRCFELKLVLEFVVFCVMVV